jgi:hypothetical protein
MFPFLLVLEVSLVQIRYCGQSRVRNPGYRAVTLQPLAHSRAPAIELVLGKTPI